MYRAYGTIAPTITIKQEAGAVREGYIVGGLAGLLLDWLDVDRKTALMGDPMKSPLDILAEHFETEISPSDVVLPDEELLSEYQNLNNLNPIDLDTQAQKMLPILKDLKSQDEEGYQMVLAELEGSPELLEKILMLMEE